MRPLHLSILAILAPTTALTSASPLPARASLLPRSRFCANAPATVAGTPLPPHRRARSLIWCSPSSNTFIVLTTHGAFPGIPAMQLPTLLISAAEVLIAHVQQLGDGVMPSLAGGGIFSWKGEEGLALEVANANNHQTTYGVLAAALLALCQYMSETGVVERASFDVYDGPNQVGLGWIG